MKKFKVLVIEHLLKNNVVAKSGDIVEEAQLTSSATELVEAGFISAVESDETVVDTEAEEIETVIEKEEVSDIVEEAQLTSSAKKGKVLKEK